MIGHKSSSELTITSSSGEERCREIKSVDIIVSTSFCSFRTIKSCGVIVQLGLGHFCCAKNCGNTASIQFEEVHHADAERLHVIFDWPLRGRYVCHMWLSGSQCKLNVISAALIAVTVCPLPAGSDTVMGKVFWMSAETV